MSVILSIETSTQACSVALHNDGRLQTYMELQIEKSHSEKLTILIDQVVRLSNLELKDVDAIAVSKGPGSYTGLRVGTSTVKGLAMALEKPIIAINTLESMALEVSGFNQSGALLCPMIDARRMEVYCALFDDNLQELEKTQAKILDENSFSEYLEKHQILFFGDGSAKFNNILANRNGLFIGNLVPKAKYIGELAFSAFNDGRFENLSAFEPFYLKDFVMNKK